MLSIEDEPDCKCFIYRSPLFNLYIPIHPFNFYIMLIFFNIEDNRSSRFVNFIQSKQILLYVITKKNSAMKPITKKEGFDKKNYSKW